MPTAQQETERVLYVAPFVTENVLEEYDVVYSNGGQNIMSAVLESLNANDVALTVLAPFVLDGDDEDRLLRRSSRFKTSCCDIVVPPLSGIPVFSRVFVVLTTALWLFHALLTEDYDAVVFFNFLDRTATPAVLGKLFDVDVLVHYADSYSDFHNSRMRAVERFYMYIGTWTLDGAICMNEPMTRVVPTDNTAIVRGRPSIGMPAELVESGSAVTLASGVIGMFVGRFDGSRGIDAFFEVANSVCESRAEFTFWIAGTGPELENARKTVEDHGHQNVQFLGKLPLDEYRDHLLGADVLINFQPMDQTLSRMSFPSKLLDFMATGKPIMTAEISDIGESFRDELCIVSNQTELKEQLVSFSENPDGFRSCGERAQERVNRICSEDAIAQRVRSLYRH